VELSRLQRVAVFEAQGWTEIRFGNKHSDDYVPWSSNVDGDEIEFVAQVERLDRAAVDRVLAGVGIERTTYVTIEECKAV
jgi:hypothetical protein